MVQKYHLSKIELLFIVLKLKKHQFVLKINTLGAIVCMLYIKIALLISKITTITF